MEKEKINKLRSFEKAIKEKVMELYGNYLNDDKKNSFLDKTAINDDFSYEFSGPDNIQGVVIRLVFNDLFNHIITNKEFDFSDGSKNSIPYGKCLKKGLVELFSQELSNKYNVKIDTLKNINNDLDLASKAKDKLQAGFYPLVLTCDAISIVGALNNEEITKVVDKDAVKRYIKSLKEDKVKETNNTEAKTLEEKGTIYPPIYKNGEKFIKYVDGENNIHLIKIKNIEETSRIYKEVLNQSEGKIDAYDFLQALRKSGESVPLIDKSITNTKLTSSETDMLNTLYDNNELILQVKEELSKEDTSNQETLSVKKGNIKLITEEEYIKLCNRAVNGHKLTEEELNMLNYYDKVTYGNETNLVGSETNTIIQEVKEIKENKEENKEEINEEEKEVKLTLTNKQYGYTRKSLPVLILIVTIVIGLVAGIVLYKLKTM